MSSVIKHVSFDSRTFRFSPYTRHETPVMQPGLQISTYDNNARPERQSNSVTLSEEFYAAAKSDAGILPVLNIALSGLRADPNIDFTIGAQKLSVKAVEYLMGYVEALRTLPPEKLALLEFDEHALDAEEKQWSIAFFRAKLAELLDGSDEFFHLVYRGLDNAMGPVQRDLIVYSQNNPDKAYHGSYDLAPPEAAKRDI